VDGVKVNLESASLLALQALTSCRNVVSIAGTYASAAYIVVFNWASFADLRMD